MGGAQSLTCWTDGCYLQHSRQGVGGIGVVFGPGGPEWELIHVCYIEPSQIIPHESILTNCFSCSHPDRDISCGMVGTGCTFFEIKAVSTALKAAKNAGASVVNTRIFRQDTKISITRVLNNIPFSNTVCNFPYWFFANNNVSQKAFIISKVWKLQITHLHEQLKSWDVTNVWWWCWKKLFPLLRKKCSGTSGTIATSAMPEHRAVLIRSFFFLAKQQFLFCWLWLQDTTEHFISFTSKRSRFMFNSKAKLRIQNSWYL
jgi:hypothetical protein